MDRLTIDASPRPLIDGTPAISALGWGMWRYHDDDVAAATARSMAALEAGITLFDTADIYGFGHEHGFGAAEALFGRVLAANPGLRDRIVLATKGGILPPIPYWSRGSRLIETCEASLRRLGVESIDLYQIHRPDLLAHPAELAAALDTLRQQGKIRAAGVSNYTPTQFAALAAHMPFPLISIQPEFSPLHTDPLFDGVLDQALERNLAVLSWSPLGGGRLLGAADDARTQAVAVALDAIAARQGATRAAVAYAWGMAHPSRPIPLIGSQTPDRIREATDAFKVEMTGAEWYAVLVAAMGKPLP
ncbi:aldo/keto reductase [Niveispirillum cyanobacteriorum]|nr:aldo/keto reductase [Niveispirillum cyanobacteriorum]GGE75575.1 aryl-alcohol dehydrogenase [Niveispirillum cyanobacteriorum]